MKIGVYGGSFDPPHKIHKKLCLAAAREFDLRRIIVLPTAEPPHKELYGTPARERFCMAAEEFRGEPFIISDLEQKGETAYTCETLLKLKEMYPADELYLIIGGDSMRELAAWKNPQKIADSAKIIVVSRGEGRTEEESAAREFSKKYGADISFCGTAMPDVSSTTLRSLLEFDMDTSEFLEEKVAEYIKKNGLYSRYKHLTQKLQKYLDDEKYFHSVYVAAMGDKIARALKLSPEDRERVYTACILHDCGKQMTAEDAARYGFAVYKKVMHGFLGEAVARADFGITDSGVLEAIRYHTTSAPDMSLISKIVAVADFTEDSREYSDLKIYQKEVFEDFDKGFKKILSYKYHNLLKTKKPEDIEPRTKAAYDFYCGKI